MDHVPHPFSGQSQTTHHQPRLHRRARPSTLRPQGRLPRRILRRCSSHRASANLRGYLCPSARRRNSRAHHHPVAGKFTVTRNPAATSSHCFLSSSSQTSSTRPQSSTRSALALRLSWTRFVCTGSDPRAMLKELGRRAFFRRCNDARMDCPAAFGWHSAPSTTAFNRPEAFGWRSASRAAMKAFLLIRALAREVPKTPNIISSKSTLTSTTTTAVPHQLQQTRPRHNRLHNRGRAALQRRVTHTKTIGALAPAPICEQNMNPTCGKTDHRPRIKPVIAGDTTCSVSPLTATISGSNFAIP